MSMDDDLHLLPGDCLYAAEQDMWVRYEADGTATLGAVHLAATHGQFMFFAPRPAGSRIERDRSLGVMETAKTAVAIHAPLSCTILAANAEVERDASLVARDPYEAGWLFRVQPTVAQERTALLDVAAYRAWLAPRLDRFAPPFDDDPALPTQFW
ncbi:MAG TPA: hypothetical protein VFR86_12080 [Burkholderiaceae bacterium]|nr:hypothetical protein [Burkholderiaceae bacterium]